jgi:hypothetical protein
MMPSRTPVDESLRSQDAHSDILIPLSQGQFDAVDHLNDILPSLALSTQSSSATSKPARSTQLQAVSSDVQSILSKFNAHHIRSSSELTSLTDEILRSGNRLAYEVEILRGDINSFYDLLTDRLKEDIRQFVHDESTAENEGLEPAEEGAARNSHEDPVFITQLRMLGQVKARLEAVVAIFGEAMKWPVPPSDLSAATSLISVSAPELGVQNTEEDDKARESAKSIRREVQELLDSEDGGYLALETASKRVEQFRDLATLWKGTNEEKIRLRFIESLAKQLDDRKRALDAKGLAHRGKPGNNPRSSSSQGRPSRPDGGGGLLRNLARLKDDLYLE